MGNGNYGWIVPAGMVAGGALIMNKLGILKFEPDHTTDVVVDKKKLSYQPAFYSTNADSLYNNLNSYWTNAGNVLKVLNLMKTPDDIRELYKAFGKRANTTNAGIIDINVGQNKDLKQWLLDYHTTTFNNDFVFNYFKKAGL